MRRFKNILLFTGTEDNGTAIERGIRLAKENNARLTFMDVIKPVPSGLGILADTGNSVDVEQIVSDEHHETVSDLASRYADRGVRIQTLVTVGDPAVEIVRKVLRDQHDLVIKAADGLSPVGRLFGSVARSLLRLCPCPVWILKPEIHGEFDTVLASVDLEAADQKHADLNRYILTIALSIAKQEDASLHLVSAWDLWMESLLRRRAGSDEIDTLLQNHQNNVTRALDHLLKDVGVAKDQITIHLQRGAATHVIPLAVDKTQADLVVMGTVCRTGAAGFLIGNTAESILADLTCSVLTLKPDGFRSPVEITDQVNMASPWTMPQTLV